MTDTTEAPSLDVHALVERFWADGYVKVPGLVTGDELAALQAETQAQIDGGRKEPQQDYGCSLSADGTSVHYRVDRLVRHAILNDSVLTIGAHPGIWQVMKGIFTWPITGAEAVVFKGVEGGGSVQMHTAHDKRDASWVWSHAEEICNVGIYLDRADATSGCLRVVPGSQHLPRTDIDELLALNFELDAVELHMEPGDVLFHSEFVIHGSRPTPAGSPLRRVVYLAFGGARPGPKDGELLQNPVWVLRMLEAVRRRNLRGLPSVDAAEVVPSDWARVLESVSDEQLAEALGDAAAFADVADRA